MNLSTLFELAQVFTHLVLIDNCSEAKLKFGVHLGCKKSTGTTDYQPALETNNQRITSFYHWGRGEGLGRGVEWCNFQQWTGGGK